MDNMKDNKKSFISNSKYIVHGEDLNNLGIKPSELGINPHTGKILVYWDLGLIQEEISSAYPNYESVSDLDRIQIEESVLDSFNNTHLYPSKSSEKCPDHICAINNAERYLIDIVKRACDDLWEEHTKNNIK